MGGFSATNPAKIGEKLAYIKLNIQTPCPPRGAVPVNQGRTWEVISHCSFPFEFGDGCDHSSYVPKDMQRSSGIKLYDANNPPILAATLTTKWKAFKTNNAPSDTATVLGVPVFNPGSGTNPSGQNVTITAPSGTQLKVFQPNPNLLDPSTWVLGSHGSQTGFYQNGDTIENAIEIRGTPYGTAEKVWVGYNLDTPTGDPGGDGGWNAVVNVDKTKLHRFSVWMRKLDTTPGDSPSISYLGCGWGDVSNLTGTSTDSVNGMVLRIEKSGTEYLNNPRLQHMP